MIFSWIIFIARDPDSELSLWLRNIFQLNICGRETVTHPIVSIFRKGKETSLPLHGTMMCRTLFSSQINYDCASMLHFDKNHLADLLLPTKIVWTLNGKSFHWLRLSRIMELRTNCANRFSLCCSFVSCISLSATANLKNEHSNIKHKLWQSVLRRMRRERKKNENNNNFSANWLKSTTILLNMFAQHEIWFI